MTWIYIKKNLKAWTFLSTVSLMNFYWCLIEMFFFFWFLHVYLLEHCKQENVNRLYWVFTNIWPRIPIEKLKNFSLFFHFICVDCGHETVIFCLEIYLILRVILSCWKWNILLFHTKAAKIAKILFLLILKTFYCCGE